jgi:hypothetical protein
VTVPLVFRLGAALIPAALFWFASKPALAQSGAADDGLATDEHVVLPRYHDSALSWEHSVSAETLGVGDEVQTANPTYTMGFAAKGRYYLVDDTPRGEHLSVRADAALYTELTNSDSTARRGEWSFVDTDLSLVYARRFHGQADTNGTLAELRPLMLTLPTSKVSLDSGRYFAAGALVGVNHSAPILPGRVQPTIASSVRLAVQYQRWFARATVPTNPSLQRVRLTPEGRSLPGDQLSGASLTRDQLSLSARLRLTFGQSLSWTTDFGFQPAWKYRVADQVQLCGVVATGCALVELGEDDNRYMVRTQFNSELSVRLVKSLSFELGYGNATSQIGPDGRRRGIFYSPDAGFYFSLSFTPHELAITDQYTASLPRASQQL